MNWRVTIPIIIQKVSKIARMIAFRELLLFILPIFDFYKPENKPEEKGTLVG
jgi:hypothetical protein